MRHLQYRNDFLNKKVQIDKENIRKNFRTSSLILESVPSVTNDITFGGSLIGRFINSLIRKAGIYTKYAQINGPFAALKTAMDGLVASAALNKETQKKLSIVTVKYLLTEIYNCVDSNQEVGLKVSRLIGTGDEGLVGELLEKLEKMSSEDFPDKDSLIKKLEKFRDLLKDLLEKGEIELVETDDEGVEAKGEEDEEDESDEEDDDDELEAIKIQHEFYISVKKIFESIIGLEEQITNKRVVIEGESSTGKVYMLGSKKLTPGESYLYTNPGNKKTMKVKLISTDKQLQPDSVGKYTKSIGVLKPDTVFVSTFTCLKCNGSGKTEKGAKCNVCDGNGKFDNEQEISKGIQLKKVSKPFVVNYKNLKYIPEDKEDKPGAGGVTQPTTNKVNFYKNDFKLEKHFYEMEMLPTEKRNFENFYFSLFEASLPNDSTSPMVGKSNVVKISKEETKAISAWRKILKIYGSKDVNLKVLSAELKEMIKNSTVVPDPEKRKFKFEEYDNSKLILVGKEIIKNESTIGKPISFEELIKEKLEVLTAAKQISILARVLLSFKKDLGLAKLFGKAGEHIVNFIKQYNNLKELYSYLINFEKEFEAQEEEEEESKKENRNFIYSYKKFRLFEELEDEEEDEDKEEEDESKEKKDEEKSDTDKVKEARDQSFDKNDEKKYVVEESELKKLESETESQFSKEFNIDVEKNSTHKDYVMKIVNAFGKAYRLYATDYIPSGRPGGRVSLKTFREYKYIGKSDGRGGQWTGETSTPGEGPYAIKMIFNAWQDKVTGMLEDNKYKTILQNAKFIYQGAREGSGGDIEKSSRGGKDESTRREIKVGRSLFDFINEMLNPEGGFETARKKIMKEWFSGVDIIEEGKKLEGEDKKDPKTYKGGGKGEEGQVSFFPVGHPNFKDSSYGKTAFDFFKKYKNCFFRIKYFEDKKPLFMIGYVYEIKGEKVWLKYNKGDSQNIVSKYLSKQSEDLESFNKNSKIKTKTDKDLYLAAVSKSENFTKYKPHPKFLQGRVVGSNKVEDVKEVEFDFEEIQILVKNVGEGKVEKIEIDNPTLLPRDIDTLSNLLSSYSDNKK